MDKNISSLEKSPLFHFSLHAKELFHSNFLEWIARDSELNHLFKAIMKIFGVAEMAEGFEVLRERQNLDLIVKDSGEKWYAVIENKVKSVPSKEQLKEYTDKIEKHSGDDSESVKKILLTLADDQPALAEGWRHFTYSDIIPILEDALPQVENSYKKAIISDYIAMVKGLTGIVNDIDVSDECKYLFTPCEKIEKLRIGDMIDKYRASRIARSITSKYNLTCKSGYTNKQSLIEFFREINDMSIGVQIQGSQYRHCFIDKSGQKESDLVSKSNGFLCAARKEFRSKMLQQFPDVFCAKEVKGEQKRSFCSYVGKDGKTFWYQYVTIKPEATIAQVIECVVKDAEYLMTKYKI